MTADGESNKLKLLHAMTRPHSVVTSEARTLAANMKCVLASEAELSSEVAECIQEAPAILKKKSTPIDRHSYRARDPNEFKDTDRLFVDDRNVLSIGMR